MNTTFVFEESYAPQYHLEIFDGPLDLLLKLISRNKVDIFDIPISLILTQYMEYVGKLQEYDPDIAGDFIAMAAELMLIKSRMLLPAASDQSADPRAELVRSLMDYKLAKEKAAELGDLYAIYSGRLAKESEEIDVDKTFVAPQELESLFAAFERIEKRKRLMDLAHTDEPEKNLRVIAAARIVPVSEKLDSIMTYLKKEKRTSFEALMEREATTRSDLVAAFVALLQLIGRGDVRIVADDPENPIMEINDERNQSTADA